MSSNFGLHREQDVAVVALMYGSAVFDMLFVPVPQNAFEEKSS